ncbi:hypothetical protein [Nocardia wallacei]|uniref:hypothetical protein n=1 Tax=Nocardia wallacei TaxID=480035 RepID=UPI0024586E29|nr:hypothetical protein [Nocardia wallacei]
MTVITGKITDLAGVGETDTVVFRATRLRVEPGLGDIISDRRRAYMPDEDGVITTDDLKPGFAIVRIGSDEVVIDIPDSTAPVQLGPLVDAGLPIPPEEEPRAVIGVGIRRLERITESDFAVLLAAGTADPDTEYSLVADPE